MNIAIQLEKILLGNERVLFKPVGIVKGYYDSENDIFIDEYNYEYENMYNCDIFGDRYFCTPTTQKELCQAYGVEENETWVLEDFLDKFMQVCYIGYYDMTDSVTKVIEINFDKIQKTLSKMKNRDGGVELQPDENKKFLFDIKLLEGLKEYQTIEEIRNFIDKLISANEYLDDVTNKKVDVKEQNSLTQNKPLFKLDKQESKKFNLRDMREFVLSEIVAQDEAVKRITTCIMSNFDSMDYRRKKHLLITGPTGTGKSKTIQLICEYLNIPYAKVDSTDYTQAGYVGRSVDEMLQRLIYAADGDIELAQKGVLVIDEIDKKASNGDNSGVATKAVLDSLLKITGRGIVQVDVGDSQYKETIDFDTSNLTVILTGAFEGIEKCNEENHKSIGFLKSEEDKPKKQNNIHKSLIKYGMTPELIGRIKCIVSLKPLEEKDYVQILKYSKGSPLVIEKNYLENEKGIKFSYTANFMNEIAKQAKERNVGVRGLEGVFSEALEDVQERILSGEKIKVLKLTKQTALNNKEYYVEY